MQKFYFITAALYLLLLTGCLSVHSSQRMTNSSSILNSLLSSYPAYFDSILQHKEAYRVQIIYSKIDRDALNNPHFTDYSYNLNKNQYFYPASTVKMPTAFLALEKLNQLNIAGVNKNTLLLADSNAIYNPPVPNPITNATIAEYVHEIFAVSDNVAFNHLYDFVGPQYLQERLAAKGYPDVAIKHRLQVALTNEQNRYTPSLRFIDANHHTISYLPATNSTASYATDRIYIGNGYKKGDSLVNEPLYFGDKNKVYLQDLHQILRSVLFPTSVPAQQRFVLTDADYTFLYKSMSAYPRESKNPLYDTAEYYDAYVKFLLMGAVKGTTNPHIRIFNKVGDAYGFLTDVAYIVDFEHQVEFMLSATIYCNSDGILNDDKYDYDTIGFPFMQHLGEVVYQYELKRPRAYVPDLSKFVIEY